MSGNVNVFIRRALLCGVLAASSAAHAADPIKVGMALDMSGPFATVGAEIRDSFDLAIKLLDNKLGGYPAEFIKVDMAGNPDQARALVDRWVQRDKIDFFTGPTGSNVAIALAPALNAAKVPYLSPNAGPSTLAGKQCTKYFFGVAYENEMPHEAGGALAASKNFKRIVTVVPNYPAGKDAVAGFKREYKGQIIEEMYTRVGQIDYSAEIAQLRALKPDGLYFLLPGAMGINFIKQFVAGSLSKDITLVAPAFSADEDLIGAIGEPMLGLLNASAYAHDLDNPANKAFVAQFRKAYNRYPSIYAAQAFDVMMSMDAAVRDVGGKVKDRDAVLKALHAARFNSVRGSFKYSNNNFPVLNYYTRIVTKNADGVVTNKLLNTLMTNHADHYHTECPNT